MERPASQRPLVVVLLMIGCMLAIAAPAAGAEGNGSTIFFERDLRDGTADLYAMDGAGGHQSIFFADAADIDVATGANQFAFDRDSFGEPPDIYVANMDGPGVRRLTDEPGFDFWPDWSPDGKLITFTSDRNGKPDVFVMAADGSNVVQLTDEPDGGQGSEYSPDGRHILYVTLVAGLPVIAVRNTDGSGRVVLTSGPDFEASWSPDGQRIAFVSARDGSREVYVMNADGSGEVRLTFDGNRDLGPVVFSPSGDEVAFMSRRADNYDVYVLSLRTGVERRLTSDPSVDGFPEWRPGSLASF